MSLEPLGKSFLIMDGGQLVGIQLSRDGGRWRASFCFASEAPKLFIIHFSKSFAESVKVEVSDINVFHSLAPFRVARVGPQPGYTPGTLFFSQPIPLFRYTLKFLFQVSPTYRGRLSIIGWDCSVTERRTVPGVVLCLCSRKGDGTCSSWELSKLTVQTRKNRLGGILLPVDALLAGGSYF